jgi:release factor glutamine methyltransferase
MQTAQSLAQICGLPRLEARMLLEHVLKKSREWLLAHDTDPITFEQAASFLTLAAQRRQGTPMAYLVGVREFMGHRFEVSPDVLIPRPETELLVELVLKSCLGLQRPQILDLGTGSGAIAVSVALERPDAVVVASDQSVAAIEVAQRNAHALGAKVQFWQGSWYEALPSEGQFDVIVSNPPYIAANDAHLTQGDLRFEPKDALTEHGDGLGALRAIAAGAVSRLARRGVIWLEHGFAQGPAVAQILKSNGFENVETIPDLAGLPRVTGGTLRNL